ncbi:MAG: D-alanyl-D-alanine carboxypeptidase, partial [Terriglobales bacterium]
MTSLLVCLLVFISTFAAAQGGGNCSDNAAQVPAAIKAVFDKPLYNNAVWGLRIVDLGTGKEMMDLEPRCNFFIGSVRKIFSVGELLNEVGPGYQFNTPVFRQGEVDGGGILHGDLILVASGDLTMGGRMNRDGSIAISNYDHNEADSLGNAVLTQPDPLAGYIELARRVARSGIGEITGNVIIDDRLFQPFNFRGEFNVSPIFVNDDVVDVSINAVSINPTAAENPANVAWRPVSEALAIEPTVVMGAPGAEKSFKIDPLEPACIGQPGCKASVTGKVPVDFVPPLTGKNPWVQTVRITKPSNYARTVFIEALMEAGITVHATPAAENPVQLLPRKGSYAPNRVVAYLEGQPYSADAKFILKVSYNIGADTSLVLFGLTHGVDNMNDALKAEQTNLVKHYKIPEGEFHFVDGSGGGATTATNRAVTQMLFDMKKRPAFPAFFDALPILGVDGSLGFVTQFESDPTLAGAAGQVRAKTGTY